MELTMIVVQLTEALIHSAMGLMRMEMMFSGPMIN